MDRILVLDFGGQYNQLIARRVREQHVYAEVRSYDRMTLSEIKDGGYNGIIFTGGPNSVYDLSSPHCDPGMLRLGIPVLGICYGAQLIAHMTGGQVEGAHGTSEYGKTILKTVSHPLFKGIPERSICFNLSLSRSVAIPHSSFTDWHLRYPVNVFMVPLFIEG